MENFNRVVTTRKPAPASRSESDNVISIVYKFFKEVAKVGTVYLVGYMQWSVAWLLGPILLSVLRSQWRKEFDDKRNLAKSSALLHEKDVVLARINDLPAWVFFPDIERAEWLNKIILQLWPQVNNYVRKMLKVTIEPQLAESVRDAIKLDGFKFERIILGTVAPRIGGVKVYGKNVSRHEIIMDIDLFYAGDCDISFVLKGIRGGIKDLQIHGMMRVEMKPLISTIPLVGGLQLYFLNNPQIDFDLVGAADFLDMPGLSDMLRKCVVDQISDMMVLPNKMPIKLSDEIPSAVLCMPEPQGILRIHLVEARNLEKKDISILGKGKSDPYAVIGVGAHKWKTNVIDNNLNPVWEFWCEAIIMQSKQQILDILVWDKDEGSTDDPLGRCSLNISQVVRSGRLDTWQNLEEAKHGKVHLRLSWHRLSINPDDLPAAAMEVALVSKGDLSAAVLSVYLDSCQSLPKPRPNTNPDPYVTMTVGKKTKFTGVQRRTINPVYEIGYSFLVQNPETNTLDIKVKDQKTNTDLGELSYPIATLLSKSRLSVLTQPLSLQCSGPNSNVVMSLQLRILKEAVGEEVVEEPVEEPFEDEMDKPSNDDVQTCEEADAALAALNNMKEVENKDIPLVEVEETIEDPEEAQTSTAATLIPSRKTPSFTTSAGEAGLGRILVSFRYSIQTQTLYFVVHKVMNIPLKDPANIPDPYVKIHLLPGRSKDSKRRTAVVKDSCSPDYDEQFEWVIPHAELHSRQLGITVATHKGFFASHPVIGQVVIYLNQYDFLEAQTLWFDLLPETKD